MRRLLAIVLMLGCTGGARSENSAPASATSVNVLRQLPATASRVAAARALVRDGASFTAREHALAVRFPDRFAGPTHLERSSLLWIDVTPEGVSDAPARADGATLFYPGVAPKTDAVQLFDGEHAEEFRVLHGPAASGELAWRVRFGPSIAKLTVTSGFLQALDSEGRARFRAAPLVAWDAKGVERALDVRVDVVAPNEARVVASLDTRGLNYPIVIDPAWGATGSLAVARIYLPPVKLPSGKILATGGKDATPHSTAEIFDPATLSWTVIAPMKTARRSHAAGVLASGKVIVAGGYLTSNTPTSLAEIYDPATNTWADAAPMPRAAYQLAGIGVGGKFIVSGGQPTTGNNAGYVYDETSGAWSTVANTMTFGRNEHGVVAVSPTRALFIGGFGGPTSTDFWDATTGLFSPGPSLSFNRYAPGVAKLTSGRVLVVTGDRTDGELYDPATGAFSVVAGISMVRQQTTAVAALAGDKAIFSGHLYTSTTSDLFTGSSKTWSLGPTIVAQRNLGLAIGLDDGRGLVFGGQQPSGYPFTASEIYADSVAAGANCTSNGQCTSGFCVEGVCCDRACTGTCEACNEPASKGTCVAITGAPRAGHGICAGSGTCAGVCDGTSGACTYPSSSASCVTATCAGGIEQPAAYCNGAGACGATPSTRNCGLFTCGATSCKTTCASDTDCVSTAFCNTTTSLCEAKKAGGGTCTTAAACASGFCASGVCCDKACTGACETCNASGSVGTCQLRANGTVCGADACVDGQLTVAAKCDGASPSCPAPAPTPCPSGFACASDGKTCKTSCATGADCTTGYCDLASAKCATAPTDAGVVADAGAVAEAGAPKLPEKPAVSNEFTRCTKNAECSTGFCVDGVCCDTACTDKCSSCALLSSPGKCTVEPIGVDLRNDCGPANQCLGTCDGSGQCIGAGSGTMCARNRCSGPSNGVGPAYCSAPGAKCPVDDATPFDCSPYICEAAFGACRSNCTATADCANGFICDVPSKTCVAIPPPAEDEGGCSTGRASGRHVGGIAVVLALVGVLRRRRERR